MFDTDFLQLLSHVVLGTILVSVGDVVVSGGSEQLLGEVCRSVPDTQDHLLGVRNTCHTCC